MIHCIWLTASDKEVSGRCALEKQQGATRIVTGESGQDMM